MFCCKEDNYIGNYFQALTYLSFTQAIIKRTRQRSKIRTCPAVQHPSGILCFVKKERNAQKEDKYTSTLK